HAVRPSWRCHGRVHADIQYSCAAAIGISFRTSRATATRPPSRRSAILERYAAPCSNATGGTGFPGCRSVLAIARSLALDRPTAVLEVPIPDTVVRHPGEVAVPGRVVDLAVARGAPDDYTVRFTLDSGKVIEATGLEVYDPPAPFAGAAE